MINETTGGDEMEGFDTYAAILVKAGAKFVEPKKHGFSRAYALDSFGTHIVFSVFKNLVTAKFGVVEVKADELTIDGCWPNGFKTNLNLMLKGEPCCVIPIEEYAVKS